MRAIEHIPRSQPPPAKTDLVRPQWPPFAILHEPVRMLTKQTGFRARNKGRDPDRRFEAFGPNLAQHGPHIAAEGLPGLEPVAHPGLIAVIDLDIAQPGKMLV